MELVGSIPKTVCPQMTSESTKQLGEPPSESAKPARTPSVLDHEPAEIVGDNAVSNDAGTETPPIVLGRRTVSLSAIRCMKDGVKRHS